MGKFHAYLSEADLATRYMLLDTSEFPAMGKHVELPIADTASEPRAMGSTRETAIVIDSDSEESISEDRARAPGQVGSDTTPEYNGNNSDTGFSAAPSEVHTVREPRTKQDVDKSNEAGAGAVTSRQAAAYEEPVYRGWSRHI
jgi:hypothetical protein